MSESPHALKAKIEFLHLENQQLRATVEDLQTAVHINKQSLKAMIAQDEQQKQRSFEESSVKALKIVISEQQKEIEKLMGSLDRVQKERDFAQGKALISEEITYAVEKSEKKLISELESNISELQATIAKQSHKIQFLEKQVDQKEDLTGVLVKYRDVIHPNSASILLHDEMETLHQLIVRLQLQLNYFKSIQLRLVSLLHRLLTSIQNKISDQDFDFDEEHEKSQSEFLQILELIQQCKLPNVELPVRQVASSHSPLNTDVIGSPIPSPFPAKAPQIKKVFANLNQTYDGIQMEERKAVVPKLNLQKAFQIQQINAKRSTQQQKLSEDQMQTKIKKLEQELDETKKNLQREMILNKHYEIENEQMRRHIRQVEGNNDILVKSNMSYNQKWQKIQKSFLYYKTFFVEHKDQFSQLQQLVQSEKEKVNSFEDQSDRNFNSARLLSTNQNNKCSTLRKKQHDSTQLLQNGFLYQDTSLMEVERALNRVDQSYTQHVERMHSESMVDQSAMDCELGHACMERGDESDSNRGEWKEQCKRQWTLMATQIHQKRQKEMVQPIKASIPFQKLTNIKI